MLFFRLLVLVCISTIYLYSNSNIAVIVSKNSSLNNISKSELSKIFLSKTKILPNSKKALVVEIANKDIQKVFYKNISKKTQKQLKKYWATMIFTGRGMPPKKLKTVDEIIKFIQNNDNAISYVEKNKINSKNIKILMEIK
ncbi:hypothetical protein N9W00_01060 [Arcobacteraceae bacterium]|nr:hypothetical protein [Arcobacteraceae bacterium]